MNYDFRQKHLDSYERKILSKGNIYYNIGYGSYSLEDFAYYNEVSLYNFGLDIVHTTKPQESYYILKQDYLAMVEKYYPEEKEEKMENPTKKQILKAAETSPEAKEALTMLYPHLFNPKCLSQEEINKYNDQWSSSYNLISKMGGRSGDTLFKFLKVVTSGEYKGKGFYVSKDEEGIQQFKMVKDSNGYTILVPVID